MKIAIVGAMKEETSLILDKLEDVQLEGKNLYPFHRGFFHDHEILLMVTGIGKVNGAISTQRLIDLHRPELVVMVGVAGAIEKIAIGDTVLVAKVAHHDLEPGVLLNHPPYLAQDSGEFFPTDPEYLQRAIQAAGDLKLDYRVFTGPVVSGETFIEKEGREEIIKRFAPLAVDMEIAGVAHACYRSEVPFLALKSITDTEEDSGLGVFEENYKLARENAQNLLLEILKKL